MDGHINTAFAHERELQDKFMRTYTNYSIEDILVGYRGVSLVIRHILGECDIVFIPMQDFKDFIESVKA